jgi:small subunit ribosomal protein S8
MTDPIADLLTRVRNASSAGHPTVTIPASRTKERILEVLKREGYIDRVEPLKDEDGKTSLKIYLRYSLQGRPVIKELRRMSRSGKRVYLAKDEIPRSKGGLGIVIVSTSQGMVTDEEARKLGVGGEPICSVF